jgi:peroxiredoxin Q/BCP
VDENHKIAETYGVWGEKKMYGRSYMGVNRSHFVIDEAGTIVDAQAKISPKESPTKALASVSG